MAEKGEATAGQENEIGRDRLDQLPDRLDRRRVRKGPESPYKIRSGQEPSEQIPENLAVGPESPRETEVVEDGSEES